MKAIWMTVAIALSLSTVACGGAEGSCKSMCGKAAKCDKGDERYLDDEDACKEECEKNSDLADEADCSKEADKLASCAKKNFECDGSGDEECTEEYEDLMKCAQ